MRSILYFSYFPCSTGTNQQNRMSIRNLRYFKLCSESNTTVKKSMHHMELEKHGLRLENILTHNRSQIKNDNPLNGAHFPVLERWLQSQTSFL